MIQTIKTPVNLNQAAEFFKRAGESHMEARKLLTALAVGSIGVLYATLTGKDAPVLSNCGKSIAILALIAMALSTASRFAAWRAEASWAFEAGHAFKDHPNLDDPPRGKSHDRKKLCDIAQLCLFAVGIGAATVLTIMTVVLK